MFRLPTATVILAALIVPAPAIAQGTSTPPAGVLLAYTYARPAFDADRLTTNGSGQGWAAGAEVMAPIHIGLVSRVDAIYGPPTAIGPAHGPGGLTTRSSLYLWTIGPQISLPLSPRLRLVASGVLGTVHATAFRNNLDFVSVERGTRFVAGMNAGVDLRLHPRFDLRVDVAYRRSDIFGQPLRVFQPTAGIVWRP